RALRTTTSRPGGRGAGAPVPGLQDAPAPGGPRRCAASAPPAGPAMARARVTRRQAASPHVQAEPGRGSVAVGPSLRARRELPDPSARGHRTRGTPVRGAHGQSAALRRAELPETIAVPTLRPARLKRSSRLPRPATGRDGPGRIARPALATPPVERGG